MASNTPLKPSFPPFHYILSFTCQTKNWTEMCGENMNMLKACGKMLSKARLEKNWGTSFDERAIYYKILHFQGNWENSLCCPNFPCVVPKFPVFSLSGKIDNQIPCFPCAVATLNVTSVSSKLPNIDKSQQICICALSQH